jgi:uncharacterized protein
VRRLRRICDAPDHHLWTDSVSLLDEDLFRPDLIVGHRNITDVYLLGLAVRRRRKLVTFDRSIPAAAVIGAGPGSLEVLSGSVAI